MKRIGRKTIAILIWFAYLIPLWRITNLRKWANGLQRWIAERNAERAPLSVFDTSSQLYDYLKANFAWREDKLARWLPFGDWSSRPDVFQAHLNKPGGTDGDCDDHATYAADRLRRIPGVTDVVLMSCWTSKKGHTVATWRETPPGELEAQLYVGDYAKVPVADYAEALEIVRTRHKWSRELAGWVFETPDLDLIAIWPKLP